MKSIQIITIGKLSCCGGHDEKRDERIIKKEKAKKYCHQKGIKKTEVEPPKG